MRGGAYRSSGRLALCLGLVAVASAMSERHLALQRSTPAADSTVTGSPPVIQLWFNQELQPAISLIQLEGPGGSVPLGKTQTLEDDPRSIFATVPALTAGRYTVKWRAAGDDGHPVRRAFEFTVSTER